MKRRDFLQGLGLASAAPLVPAPVAANATDAATDPARVPQRALFQQQAYFDLDDSGAAYTPPLTNKSTVEYRMSLTHEEFLRRHWFC